MRPVAHPRIVRTEDSMKLRHLITVGVLVAVGTGAAVILLTRDTGTAGPVTQQPKTEVRLLPGSQNIGQVPRIAEIAKEFLKSYRTSREIWPEPAAIYEGENRWVVGFHYKQPGKPMGPSVIIDKTDLSCRFAPMR